MSLTQIIDAVQASQKTQQEIRSQLLPVSDAQKLFFDDEDTTISLLAIAEALSCSDDSGLSDKAVDMRDEIVALLKAYNDEVEECVKENRTYNVDIHGKEHLEVLNMEKILETAPEKVLSRKVEINTLKFTDEHMKAFREIYLELGVTHFLKEELRDVVYFDPKVSPNLRDLIAERFLVRFPDYVNPKGYMNVTSVDFINHLQRIQKAAVK